MAEPTRFAARTAWNLAPNRLARAVAERRRAGLEVLDLTESNPTRCGFSFPAPPALDSPAEYDPQPLGLLSARQAVVDYYAASWKLALRPEQFLLTSGSSEAYGRLFRLLAEPGDKILVPQPSYPLFEFLARIDDVEPAGYALDADHGWAIEFAALEAAADHRARAVVVVHPNNPTGSLLDDQDRDRLVGFCRARGLPLIADEVFLDYAFQPARSLAGESGALTFTISGLSKIAALPQMKLGWIVATGPDAPVREAMARLEVIADTYLSVATPVQQALAGLLADRDAVQREIRERLRVNLAALDEQLERQPLVSRREVAAGWSVLLRVPRLASDEDWAVELVERDGVLLHPGHFFDFATEGYLVASLIARPEVFAEGIRRLLARVGSRAGV